MPQMYVKRALGRVLLAAAFLVLAMPAAAFAAGPQPLPGYQPTFVTEREEGVWEDCIWAAAAMLLDKWTSGTTTVNRERLRKLSGDKAGGSNLRDVQRAFAKIGHRLPISPYDGVAVSWNALLERLAAGGGAILLGDYGKLPARFGRWDPDFWSRKGTGDDHALYVDRYDRRTSSVLVMDPLAPQGWGGEWIPASALKKFAWRNGGGALSVAMTPPALTSQFLGVAFGAATATADATAVHLAWPVTEAPHGWTYPGATVSAQIAPLAAIDPMAWIVGALPAGASAAPLAAPSATVADGLLKAAIPVPAAPGIYGLTVTLADRRFGEQVAAAGPLNLYVPGPRAAAYEVPASLSVAAGALARIPVKVTNVGSTSWAELPFVGWLPLDGQPKQNLRLTGTWVRQASTAAPGAILPRPPAPFDITDLYLEAAEARTVDASVRAPVDAGTWRLVLDLVDNAGQSLALAGSAPGIILVEVLGPGQVPSGQ